MFFASPFCVYKKLIIECDDDGNKSLNVAGLDFLIDQRNKSDQNVNGIIYDLGIYLKSYDRIYGGTGNDKISGDAGDDYLAGAEGDDIYYVNDSNRHYTISMNGTIFYATSKTSPLRKVYGLSYSEYMTGFDNDSITLFGNAGDDTYIVSEGCDTISQV